MKLLLALGLVALLPLVVGAQSQPVDPNGAIATLNALPVQYRAGVVKLSADDAKPNPKTWYVLAKNADEANDVYSLTLANGVIREEKPSFDFRALLGKPTAINLAAVRIDSTAAWEVARRYCQSKQRQLGSASYVLEQKGAAAAPVWFVWCYDPNGRSIGKLEILATDGSVISSD